MLMSLGINLMYVALLLDIMTCAIWGEIVTKCRAYFMAETAL